MINRRIPSDWSNQRVVSHGARHEEREREAESEGKRNTINSEFERGVSIYEDGGGGGGGEGWMRISRPWKRSGSWRETDAMDGRRKNAREKER